ncbi:putative transcription initiation factor IIB-like protein, partial [Tetrabaena socialis]
MAYYQPSSWDEPCIECYAIGTKTVNTVEAEVYCTQCGTVSESRMMDYRPERRAYTDDTGRKDDPYASLFGAALGCTTETSTSLGKQLARVNVETHRVSASGKPRPPRGIEEVIRKFEHIVAAAHIPEAVCRTANEMFVDFSATTRTVGSGRDAAYAACMYYASNSSERRRSMTEIARDFGIDKDFASVCNKVHSTLVDNKKWAPFFLDRAVKGTDLVQRMVRSCLSDKVQDAVRVKVVFTC